MAEINPAREICRTAYQFHHGNVAETFNPVVFTGAVSRNRAVVQHIQSFSGKEIPVDETGVYGAIGAATTGSRRKFAGKIIGADIVIDEITAHARVTLSMLKPITGAQNLPMCSLTTKMRLKRGQGPSLVVFFMLNRLDMC